MTQRETSTTETTCQTTPPPAGAPDNPLSRRVALGALAALPCAGAAMAAPTSARAMESAGNGIAADARLMAADDRAAGALFTNVQGFITRMLSQWGASTVGWMLGRGGAVTRSVADKLGDRISVRDFGARGDGKADDTAAIQRAVTAMAALPEGGHVYFPEGVYRITGAIGIPFATGWKITGASRGAVVIRQDTDNTPIFRLSGDLSHSWVIEEITLDWARQQPAPHTQAVGILFSATAATACGFYNFQLRRLTFNKGFRGIDIDAQKRAPVWGCKIVDVIGGGQMSGATVRLIPSPAIGQPNIMLENMHIDATGPVEPSIQINYCDSLLLKNIEWNNGGGPTGNVPVLMLLQAKTTMIACRSESHRFRDARGAAIWHLVQSSVTAIGCTITSPTGSSSGNVAFRGIMGTRANLIDLTIGSATTGWLTAYSFPEVALIDKVTVSGQCTTDSMKFLGTPTSPRLDLSARLSEVPEYPGDADIALTSRSSGVQMCIVPLTADRHWTLPDNKDHQMAPGMAIEIVREGGEKPGPFRLTVIDPISGQNHVFAAGISGSVRYRFADGRYVKVAVSTFAKTG